MEGQGFEAAEVFTLLESSNPQVVQQIKGLIHEILNETAKETWMLYGLVDRYVTTNSLRCLDILTGIKEPHDKHLFDKLNDYLKTNATRLPILTLFGHVVCKQPSWLYKIANHSLFPALLKLLKTDTEVPVLMSALLVLVTLLPTIPANVSHHLGSIFEVFSRLAAWKTNKPASVPEEYVLHLQVGVYALFHRLYGMYPCNFLAYLRSHYGNRENLQVFAESIRPMLEHVRMHPLLVTASKEAEVTTCRWRSMETHDVVMECAKVSLDMLEGTREETVPSSSYLYQSIPLSGNEQEVTQVSDDIQRIDYMTVSSLDSNPDALLSRLLQDGVAVASPSKACASTVSTSRSSPEHNLNSVLSSTQPLTPPIQLDHPPTSGLRSRRDSSGQVGQTSQPSSPFRKIASPFRFQPISDDLPSNKESASSPRPPPSPATKEFPFPHVELSHSAPTGGGLANIRPLRLGDGVELHHLSTEEDKYNDQEVSEIVGGGSKQLPPRTPKSATGEAQPEFYQRSDSVIHDEADGIPAADLEESVDNSIDKWRDFVRNVNRLRYYSQCGPSPDLAEVLGIPSPVKRSKSCPDIAKATLDKQEAHHPGLSVEAELADHTTSEQRMTESDLGRQSSSETTGAVISVLGDNRSMLPEAQRHVLPYEYLFASALPPLFVSRCAHCSHCQEGRPRPLHLSPTEILDQHLRVSSSLHSTTPQMVTPKASNSSATDELAVLRNQVILLYNQLLFERNKREVHAERNRRLLARAKKARALEEQNLATKDQLQLQERHMTELNRTHIQLQQKVYTVSDEKCDHEQEMVLQIRSLRQELEQIKVENQDLRSQLSKKTEVTSSQAQMLQNCQAELLTAKLALKDIQSKVSTNEELRRELEMRNKELVLMGELQQKYREKFNSLPLPPNAKAETVQLKATFALEIQALKQVSEIRGQQLEAHKARLADTELQMQKKDLLITDQKNLSRAAKEEYQEQIMALKEKILKLRSMYVKVIEQNLQSQHNESPSVEVTIDDQGSETDKQSCVSSARLSTKGSGAKVKETTGSSASCGFALVQSEGMPIQQEYETAQDIENPVEFDSDTLQYIRKRMGSLSTSGLLSGFEQRLQGSGDAYPIGETGFLETTSDKGCKSKQT